jgi:integrase
MQRAHSSAWIEWLPAKQLVEGSSPSEPESILSVYLGPLPYCTIQLSISVEQNPMSHFMYALKAPDTKRQYPKRFKTFLDFLGTKGSLEDQAKEFLTKARANTPWAETELMKFIMFQKERVLSGEIVGSTIRNYFKATKLFCQMNDLTLNWSKIRRGLPTNRQAANDRAPTREEIKRLIEYPDRRIKPIIYTMVSSGIRLGAWDLLQWKHVEPITEKNGEITAAKLLVYAGDAEEYHSFITGEAYNSLIEWMDFRASYGEKITGTSWIMRDLWQTTNIDYGAKLGLATCPKKLKSSGLERILERALWEQGLRHPLTNGAKRHEWKAAHGFRKFYKSHAEQVMKPINVELTMGHNIGVSASYYRPTEKEVLEDYLKAVPLLSMSTKTKDNEYIKTELSEKDKEIAGLKGDMALMKQEVEDMQELLRNPKKLAQIAKA